VVLEGVVLDELLSEQPLSAVNAKAPTTMCFINMILPDRKFLGKLWHIYHHIKICNTNSLCGYWNDKLPKTNVFFGQQWRQHGL
jgi:hypothetical protein